jgi:hypothetical protein
MLDMDELERFKADWLDYVCELTSLNEQEATEAYVAHRTFLARHVGTGINVWRALIVPEDIIDEFSERKCRFVGRFWTASEHVANTWSCGNTYDERYPACTDGAKIIVEALITPDQIDWVETVACQLGSSYEDEFRLLGDAIVLIARCRRDDASLSVSAAALPAAGRS